MSSVDSNSTALPPASSLDSLRGRVREASLADEKTVVESLLAASELDEARRQRILERSIEIVEHCRARSDQAGTLDAFLQESGLSNREGIALMCLAYLAIAMTLGRIAMRG